MYLYTQLCIRSVYLFFHIEVFSKNTTGRDKLKKGGTDVPERARRTFLGNRRVNPSKIPERRDLLRLATIF